MAENKMGPDDVIDGWDPVMLEYPFIRKGMTLREYLEEKEYYYQHKNEIKNGTYTPLWKQK